MTCVSHAIAALTDSLRNGPKDGLTLSGTTSDPPVCRRTMTATVTQATMNASAVMAQIQ
jgi:hypothetical protein